MAKEILRKANWYDETGDFKFWAVEIAKDDKYVYIVNMDATNGRVTSGTTKAPLSYLDEVLAAHDNNEMSDWTMMNIDMLAKYNNF